MQWPCESVSFVVLIESEAAVCGWLSVCLPLCVCVWVACQLSAEQPTVESSSLHVVQKLFIVAQPHGREEEEEQGRGKDGKGNKGLHKVRRGG